MENQIKDGVEYTASNRVDSQMVVNYEPLPKEFNGRASQKQYKFKQLFREGDIAVYQKSMIPEKVDRSMANISPDYFEVFKVTRQEAGSMGDIQFAAKEIYPRDEMFGVTAWCCMSLEGAMERVERIKESELEKLGLEIDSYPKAGKL